MQDTIFLPQISSTHSSSPFPSLPLCSSSMGFSVAFHHCLLYLLQQQTKELVIAKKGWEQNLREARGRWAVTAQLRLFLQPSYGHHGPRVLPGWAADRSAWPGSLLQSCHPGTSSQCLDRSSTLPGAGTPPGFVQRGKKPRKTEELLQGSTSFNVISAHPRA